MRFDISSSMFTPAAEENRLCAVESATCWLSFRVEAVAEAEPWEAIRSWAKPATLVV